MVSPASVHFAIKTVPKDIPTTLLSVRNLRVMEEELVHLQRLQTLRDGVSSGTLNVRTAFMLSAVACAMLHVQMACGI